MNVYGWNPGRDGSDSDPQPTGLEGSMSRLGITGRDTYPERLGSSDCVYYMRTGFCGFGARCRYNHPRDRAAVMTAVRLAGGEYPERPGEPFCQYYLLTGTCKFGATCKFHHPRNGGGSLSNVPLSHQGYPLRPGLKECSYYLKTGQCKFGVTCKYHHPQPAGSSMPATAPPFYPSVQSSPVTMIEPVGQPFDSITPPRPHLLPGSYVSGAYSPMLLSPGVLPIPGWASYSGSVSPAMSPGAQPTSGVGSLFRMPQLSSSTPTAARPYPSFLSSVGQSEVNREEVRFPERPGQPECQYYLKTGNCKFGSSCRYHHPPERAAATTACYLSPLGLPLRPGEQVCPFYMQNGYCKFGPTCKFDHPITALQQDMLIA